LRLFPFANRGAARRRRLLRAPPPARGLESCTPQNCVRDVSHFTQRDFAEPLTQLARPFRASVRPALLLTERFSSAP
jgi:hypothetical protein